MRRLLSAEFYKLWKSVGFRVCLIVFFIQDVIYLLSVGFVGDLLGMELNGFEQFNYLLTAFSGSTVSGMLFGFMAASLITSDYKSRDIQCAIAQGHSRVLFPIYMVIAIVAILLLGATSIKEEAPEGKPSTFAECIALLGNPFILLMFVGIMCHVGIDVGTNTTAPKILMERLGMDIHAAAFATSLYFIFRTVGCLTGSLILAHWTPKKFFVVSVVLMVASMAGFLLFDSKALLYVSIALVGYGNSNVFSILFSQALLSMPQRQNEVSGLMIMGLFGGTVFPLLMGFASDALHSQTGALLVLAVGVFYLLFLFTKLK